MGPWPDPAAFSSYIYLVTPNRILCLLQVPSIFFQKHQHIQHVESAQICDITKSHLRNLKCLNASDLPTVYTPKEVTFLELARLPFMVSCNQAASYCRPRHFINMFLMACLLFLCFKAWSHGEICIICWTTTKGIQTCGSFVSGWWEGNSRVLVISQLIAMFSIKKKHIKEMFNES